MYKRENTHKLIDELNYIEDVLEIIKSKEDVINNIVYEFCKVKDIRNTIRKIYNKEILDEVELYEVKIFSRISREISENFKNTELNIYYIVFKDLEDVIKLLDPDSLNLSTFQIYNSYSDKLALIRSQKHEIEKAIFKETDIEKIEKLKNERLEIVIKEQEEELKIKRYLTKKIYNHVDDLLINIKSIGKLDLIISKAKLSIKYGGVKPNINYENKIEFIDIVNPNLYELLKSQNKSYIPISIDIDKKVSIITGANMGGKSISIKSICLNLYLFQCGFYVFAKSANLCVLDFIYLINDDMQNVEKGLSTFGAEIIKLKEITKLMKVKNGFIALDEFARGTNPTEARILIKSICNYFNMYDSISLISTHLDNMNIQNVSYYRVIGLKNVDFDKLRRMLYLKTHEGVEIIQEYMDYRLEKLDEESSVPKDAIKICKLLNLDDEIINIANELSENIRGE